MQAQILTVVHHRNLVSLVGYCDEAENKALIYEFMSNGNLGNHLSGKLWFWLNRKIFPKMYVLDSLWWLFLFADTDSSAKVLSWMERLQIAVDAAQGINK